MERQLFYKGAQFETYIYKYLEIYSAKLKPYTRLICN